MDDAFGDGDDGGGERRSRNGSCGIVKGIALVETRIYFAKSQRFIDKLFSAPGRNFSSCNRQTKFRVNKAVFKHLITKVNREKFPRYNTFHSNLSLSILRFSVPFPQFWHSFYSWCISRSRPEYPNLSTAIAHTPRTITASELPDSKRQENFDVDFSLSDYIRIMEFNSATNSLPLSKNKWKFLVPLLLRTYLPTYLPPSLPLPLPMTGFFCFFFFLLQLRTNYAEI